jgi:hypothetical protein
LDPRTLWLRVRAGFGVGSKADTLAFLVGMQGAPSTARSIAYATGYSSVSIRQAVEEMALARLIRGTKKHPFEYLPPLRPWTELLELEDPGEASATGGGEGQHGPDVIGLQIREVLQDLFVGHSRGEIIKNLVDRDP